MGILPEAQLPFDARPHVGGRLVEGDRCRERGHHTLGPVEVQLGALQIRARYRLGVARDHAQAERVRLAGDDY